jgi:hypothetical protein
MENLKKEVTTFRAAATIINTLIPTKESVRLNSLTLYNSILG